MKMKDDLDELPKEIDLTGAKRGHFANRLNRNTVAVAIDPDLYELFPTSESVNAALRLVVRAGELTAKVTTKAS
jgi:hypothetical protein